jgi:hypothetical protein
MQTSTSFFSSFSKSHRHAPQDHHTPGHLNTQSPSLSRPQSTAATSHSSSHSSRVLSHRRSFSRSSQFDRPTTLKRSLSLRSSHHIQTSPHSSHHRSPVQSSISPTLDKSSDLPLERPRSRALTSIMTQPAGLQRTMSYGNGVLAPPAQIGQTGGQQTAQAVFQHITETATKRISTLDYLRKSYVSAPPHPSLQLPPWPTHEPN